MFDGNRYSLNLESRLPNHSAQTRSKIRRNIFMYIINFSNGCFVKTNYSQGLGIPVRFQKIDSFFETLRIGVLVYAGDLAL